MKKSLRILSLAVLTVMLLTLLPSCGKKEEIKLTNVFRETMLKLPEKYQDTEHYSIGNLTQSGDTVYINMYYYNYDDKTGDYENYQILVPMSANGDFGEEIAVKIENTNPENGYTYCNSITPAPDGSVWAVIVSVDYTSDNYMEQCELRNYHNGTFDVFPIDNTTQDGEYFYINDIYPCDDGSVVIQAYDSILTLAPDGQFRKVKLDLPEGGPNSGVSIEGMMQMNGRIYAQIYSWTSTTTDYTSSSKFCEIDPVTGKLGEEIQMPGNVSAYNMMFGEGYDYYYNDRSGAIWGCTFGSEEKVEVLNFLNSDINSNNLNNVLPLSADRFIAIGYDRDTYENQVLMYDRIPDEQIEKRVYITLAATYLYYDLREKIIDFNKSNSEYRIIFQDYSQYNTNDNYNAGLDRLNSDLISGKIPDILLVTSEMPYDSYVSKGLFTDLYALMDDDKDFNRADYLENIFQAYEVDGKLYSLIPTFYLSTLAAKTELLEGLDHWTIEQFMDFAKAHPEIQMFDYDFNRSTFLQMMLTYCRDQFIDRKTGECHFDSEAFKNLLAFTKTLTTDDFWSNVDYNEVGEDFWQEYGNRFAENKVLLMQYSMWDITDSYKSLIYYSLKGDATIIGFPCDKGNGAVIEANSEYAVARRSKCKEGAWAFLKSLISEDELMPKKTQWGYYQYPNGIPVLKAAVEKCFEIAMTPPEDNRGSYVYAETAVPTVIAIDGPAVIYDDYVDPYSKPLTEEQVDAIRSLLTNVTQVARYDEELINIVNEEAEYYFSDSKSLDDVAAIIQNRISMYIAESR